MPTERPPEPEPDTDPDHGSLRGALVSVLLMAAFFLLTWFAMFALVLERR